MGTIRGVMMNIGMLGRKVGMTRVFTQDGASIPVTVVDVTPNRVSQIKTLETDGYNAVQLTGGKKEIKRLSKPLKGHFAKAKIDAGDFIKEYKLEEIDSLELGKELTVADVFNEIKYVDVSAVSKGKGFAGVVKRHNFRTQDATHGNSLSHRAPGSIGQNQTPGRVFKGKKMAGQMGNKRCTVQSLELVKIDSERNLLLIKGAVPGAPGSKVEVKPAVKKEVRGK